MTTTATTPANPATEPAEVIKLGSMYYKPSLTKEQEIKLIEKLCYSDSYFSQFFKKDCSIMTSNIRNDWAIETGCSFMVLAEREERLTRELEEAQTRIHALETERAEIVGAAQTRIKELETKMYQILDRLIRNEGAENPTPASCFFSRDEIVQCKLSEGHLHLITDPERVYILSRITGKATDEIPITINPR